jgi:hypothetical protein
MSTQLLEDRVAALEEEVAQLKRDRETVPSAQLPWYDRVFGMFADDPLFEEAVRLGKEYRESLREESDSETDGAA